MTFSRSATAVTLLLWSAGPIAAQAPVSERTLSSISTPSSVETRLGTLEFFDGLPSEETVATVYDNLDFIRGVEVFLNAMPGASVFAIRHGLRSVGVPDNTLALFQDQMDSAAIFLTGNTESIYCFSCLDLTDGPVVMETPPNVLGIFDDMWFRWIGDFGNAGPDAGQGGSYLMLPPGFPARSRRTTSPTLRRPTASSSFCAASRWTATQRRPRNRSAPTPVYTRSARRRTAPKRRSWMSRGWPSTRSIPTMPPTTTRSTT